MKAGLNNVHWALQDLPANGWFSRCSLTGEALPITHTLGYALRGVIEAYRLSPQPDLLDAALRTGKGLLSALRGDGFLPGKLDAAWSGTGNWACLTGTAQVALCWMHLAQITGDSNFLDAARRANAFIRRTVRLDGALAQVGGVKGSFPVDGGYGPFEYLNWAPKFAADSLMLEADLLAIPAR